MRETQRAFVRRLLFQRGEAGVGAHELTYQHGITRAAAIIHTLRREDRLPIETRQKAGEQAVYVWHRNPPRPRPVAPPPLPPEPEGESLSWDELGERLRAGL